MKNVLVTAIHPAPGPEKKVVSEGQACQLPFQTRQKNRVARLSGIAGRIVVLLLAAAAPAVLAQQTAAPAMSVCQARRAIVTELQRVDTSCFTCLNSQPSGVAFNVGELEFQAEPRSFKKEFPKGTYRVELKTLGDVNSDLVRRAFVAGGDFYGLLINGRPAIDERSHSHDREEVIRENLSNSSVLGCLQWRTKGSDVDKRAFQTFADAMNALRLYARNYNPSQGMPPACFADKDEQTRIWADFQQKAAAWRALPAKPPISDDVKQHRLLAEDAFNQKQFETAAAEYEAGLEIDPLWAQGHFNAAVIYGELKNYDDAVWHMRCYLELLPNAPDAQDARDQMLLWQGKAKQQSATQ